MTRCFIAVDLPEELKHKIINIQEQLAGFDVRLVEKENLHFTLKFLGEVGEEVSRVISSRLKGIAAAVHPFRILISGIGAFPNENYIRVIWLGTNNGGFIKLHLAVEDALSGLFKKEKPVPHLTIARVRSVKSKKEIAGFIAHNRAIEIGSMVVDKIKLKKSTLTRSGPLYEDIEVFELGSSDKR